MNYKILKSEKEWQELRDELNKEYFKRREERGITDEDKPVKYPVIYFYDYVESGCMDFIDVYIVDLSDCKECVDKIKIY